MFLPPWIALGTRAHREQLNTRGENTLRYTRYFGYLAEQYVLTLGESVRRDGNGCARSSNAGRRRSRLSLETMRGVWTWLLDLAAVFFLLLRVSLAGAAKVLP
jgi:hypothetical protein